MKMNRLLPGFLALTATTLLSPLSFAEETVLGRAGDAEITVGELRTLLADLGVKEGSVTNADPAILSQVVRSLLVQRVLLREARDKGWDQQPAVKAQADRARETAITESYLRSVSAPSEGFPSEAELTAAYDANKAALLVPKSYRLAQIFIAAPKGVDRAVEDKAGEKIAKIRNALEAKDADFADLATTFSEERESASRGGEIGWLMETEVQPEIREKLPEMALNVISEPLRLADGWHIIKVLDIREPFTPTLEQVRAQLTERLRAERIKANSEAYLAHLLKEKPVAINELALTQALPK